MLNKRLSLMLLNVAYYAIDPPLFTILHNNSHNYYCSERAGSGRKTLAPPTGNKEKYGWLARLRCYIGIYWNIVSTDYKDGGRQM